MNYRNRTGLLELASSDRTAKRLGRSAKIAALSEPRRKEFLVPPLTARYTRVLLLSNVLDADILAAESNPGWDEDFDSTPLWVDEPYSRRGKSADGRCAIVFVQDPLREIRYFHIFGDDLDRHEATIRGRLGTFTRQEIMSAVTAAKAPAEKIAAIYLAAASAEMVVDRTLFEFLTRSLTDLDARVRLAAIDAALLAFWPALRAPLERRSQEDPVPDLRAFAHETLSTLSAHVWEAQTGGFDFTPLPPDRRRVTPLTGVGDRWYEAAHGENFPKRRAPGAPAPLPSPKPEFVIPGWLAGLMEGGDWGQIRWDTLEQIRANAKQRLGWKAPELMPALPIDTANEVLLWECMVPLGVGSKFTDRCGRTDQSQIFINRDDPKELLLAFGQDHLPSFWVPAGRTRAAIDAVIGAYLFQGLPPQSGLPFQGRLFLETGGGLVPEFADAERILEKSPFTDMLPWGNSQPADPYPERVTLGRIPIAELRRFIAQHPNDFPRTGIRTRYSRAIIQLISWQDCCFADLYFQPVPSNDWVAKHHAGLCADFPSHTPVDVVGALYGLACLGLDRVRSQMGETDDEHQCQVIKEIVRFMEQGRAE